MYPQSLSFQQDLLRWEVDSDPFYHVNNTASTSSSLGHIFQPQPIRPIGGSLVWGADRRALVGQEDDQTYLDEDSYGTTYFPGPENTLGLFSSDPKHSIVASSAVRHLSPSPPTHLQIHDYEIEGGWSFDAIGRTHYVPHGGITAVDDSEEEENADILAEDSRTFLDDQLPPETTPPPRPKQRPIELIPLPLLDRLPLSDESNTRIDPPPLPRYISDSNDQCRTTRTTYSSSTILTQSQELDTVENVLASIMTASLDIVSLHARFGALSKPNATDRALCDRVGKALHAVQDSLKRHRVVPVEQWSLRSVSCRRKYNHRLMSLQRTLRRLHMLSNVSPRVNQVHRLRKLLEQHDAKLSDLASKFNGMFDRLHDRHLNTVLAGVCADLHRRVTARKEERKTARAARSGHYEYAFHSQGRWPSMVEVS